MATNAQQIHLVLNEHPLVGRPMWRVASLAALDFGFVLIHEGALFIDVALVANFVFTGHGAQLVALESPMRVVAVIALHQSFIHAMVKGAYELCSHIQVAGVAEFR
jgi:energy-converting hydrogenase Eha subunit C